MQQYFVASWTCYSLRRIKILLLADDFVGEVLLTSDLAKFAHKHYWCYFRYECLRRKSESFWSCLLCFLSDVKAETLPLAQKWPVGKGLHSHKWSEVKVLNEAVTFYRSYLAGHHKISANHVNLFLCIYSDSSFHSPHPRHKGVAHF